MKWFQHGDVTIKPIAKIPEDIERQKNMVLAEGEVTGHKHVVKGLGALVFVTEAGKRFLSLPNGGTVTHEEHNPIEVPAGTYEIGQVRKKDHIAETVRTVMD